MPFGVAHVNLFSERWNYSAPKNTWTSPKAENKIWKELTQPLNNQPKLITQEELHKLASKTVGSAKKIYVHYTPQEGAMVLKFLF